MRNDIYNKNGLVFWDEKDINYREYLIKYISSELENTLRSMNGAFKFVRVEAPILTPTELLNKEYNEKDVFFTDNKELVLRPETTAGSYAYAKLLIQDHNSNVKLPFCVWQAGKSFRVEQDKVLSHMRLKEFYQLEFQILYSEGTKADYPESIKTTVAKLISMELGGGLLVESDRLPSYSNRTTDIEVNGMEICSMSERTDFEGAKCFEVAIGLDRCVFQKFYS